MAEKFIKHTGLVVPLDAANVDTDAIIPKQFLQKVTRTGFGAHLFNDWRFLDEKGQQPNPDFVLNFPQYQGASILLARENFGCGSSREHAPIAILGAGMPVVIGHSFARIFYRNAFNMGLLLMEVGDEVDKINDGDALEIDAATGRIRDLSNGVEITCPPLPQSMAAILSKGGLVGYVKERLARG